MASTGVPATGRSRAFANRFSGFHRAKTLIGGSSLTGVSVATGVRRSRTRIDPCFRAARTQAPVRRCNSLIEISFMCHIVTHRRSHRQALADRLRSADRENRAWPRRTFEGGIEGARRRTHHLLRNERGWRQRTRIRLTRSPNEASRYQARRVRAVPDGTAVHELLPSVEFASRPVLLVEMPASRSGGNATDQLG
jgi:hypothetical protein